MHVRVHDQGEDSDDEAESDEAALAGVEAWEPDPLDADPSRNARSRRMHDIISMLVGIYGTKDLFITEYRWIGPPLCLWVGGWAPLCACGRLGGCVCASACLSVCLSVGVWGGHVLVGESAPLCAPLWVGGCVRASACLSVCVLMGVWGLDMCWLVNQPPSVPLCGWVGACVRLPACLSAC